MMLNSDVHLIVTCLGMLAAITALCRRDHDYVQKGGIPCIA